MKTSRVGQYGFADEQQFAAAEPAETGRDVKLHTFHSRKHSPVNAMHGFQKKAYQGK
ncbi:hypothetical protein [Gimesia maris]|uniref:hypothetical protein n=1 Tax=Gimesia maris TaxID=122 RepID=UPI0018D5B8EE|nr:hypothetical protein [Gimesia maris]